jgi:hypothetical protein
MPLFYPLVEILSPPDNGPRYFRTPYLDGALGLIRRGINSEYWLEDHGRRCQLQRPLCLSSFTMVYFPLGSTVQLNHRRLRNL